MHPHPGEHCTGEQHIGTQHQQPSPGTWAPMPLGGETKLTNSNMLWEAVQMVVSKTRQHRAVCGGWQLPGNNTVPKFSLPYTKAKIPLVS